jgi:tetratricopeptide (TPR) repeat protein
MNRKATQLQTLALAAAFTASALNLQAQKAYPLPTYSAAVDKAVTVENLRAVAAQTTDPDVWLGLGFVAPPGDAVRGELFAMAVNARPDYAPVSSVLTVAMDGNVSNTVENVIQRDPSNALGHYLRGQALYSQGNSEGALNEFRQAAACPELRIYGNVAAQALFKALDALNLHDRDRLCASSWMATRFSNFRIIYLQPMQGSLGELSRAGDLNARKEISELLLVLGGQLQATDFESQVFAERAVRSAFRLKAEIAYAEKSPTANGYVSVVQALTSVQLSWPGIADHKQTPLELAQFVPGRISRAFAMADPAQANGSNLVELRATVPEGDKAAFERAKAVATAAASNLIAAAQPDSDEVVGAFFRGMPPPPTNASGPWVSLHTYVERLMLKRPEVFKAAGENEDAMKALQQAGRSDPRRLNMSRMMAVGLALFNYAVEHDQSFPPDLRVLFENGKYLKPPADGLSVINGRAYVYVANGEKMPTKHADSGLFVLLYDSVPNAAGEYQCVMADGHGQYMGGEELRKHLASRGK